MDVLVAAADEQMRRDEFRNDDYGCAAQMRSAFRRHFYDPAVVKVAATVLGGITGLLIFPCSGFGLSETALCLELDVPLSDAVFMDRCPWYERPAPFRPRAELDSFDALADYVTRVREPATVVGFNAITTHPAMYRDPACARFLEACRNNEYVCRQLYLFRRPGGRNIFPETMISGVPLSLPKLDHGTNRTS